MLVIYNKYWLWTSEDTKYTKMQQPKVQEWGSPQYPASYWDWLNCKLHPKKIHFIWEHQLAHGYFQASRGPFVKERNCLINRTPRIKPMLTMAPSPPLEKTVDVSPYLLCVSIPWDLSRLGCLDQGPGAASVCNAMPIHLVIIVN